MRSQAVIVSRLHSDSGSPWYSAVLLTFCHAVRKVSDMKTHFCGTAPRPNTAMRGTMGLFHTPLLELPLQLSQAS